MSRKSPYRSVRAPRTEFANTIAFDSAQATCSPRPGRFGSWYGAHVKVGATPEGDVRRHQLTTRGREVPVTDQSGMEQIHRADVQRGRDADLRAEVDQPVGEVETDLAVVQARVDVRGGDLDQSRRVGDPRLRHDHAHRESDAISVLTAEHRFFLGGQVEVCMRRS